MSKVKYDIKRVPRELLEQFVVGECNLDGNWLDGHSLHKLGAEIRKAAEVTLRTRSEIDQDIAKAVRDYCKDSQCPISQLGFYSEIDEDRGSFPKFIEKLLSEETSD